MCGIALWYCETCNGSCNKIYFCVGLLCFRLCASNRDVYCMRYQKKKKMVNHSLWGIYVALGGLKYNCALIHTMYKYTRAYIRVLCFLINVIIMRQIRFI